jgi:hypothetical protein
MRSAGVEGKRTPEVVDLVGDATSEGVSDAVCEKDGRLGNSVLELGSGVLKTQSLSQ